jgi:DNA-binding MarR family transcriptional regulator
MKVDKVEKGRYSYGGIDRIMHERARLSILTSLFVNPSGYNFNELKKLCNLTDGNLSRHLKILKEAGMIEVVKGYANNKPLTTCRLTKEGRARFIDYMAELEKVFKDAELSEAYKKKLIKKNKAGLSPA